MREEDEELSCYGPDDDYLLLSEERDVAGLLNRYWNDERRNEMLMRENRTGELWASWMKEADDELWELDRVLNPD